MPRYVAFLRAVNVGGRFVKMADLRDLLTDAGLIDVSTYIQSGNVLFSSSMRSAPKVEAVIEQTLLQRLGFAVDTMVRSRAELDAAISDGNALQDPFGGDGRHMVSMLKASPAPGAQQRLDEWPEPGVRGHFLDRQLHLFYGMPMTESKLTGPKLAKISGCPGTVREWRVLEAVHKLL
jgi:uncharacterized protein (DUF1697 family)